MSNQKSEKRNTSRERRQNTEKGREKADRNVTDTALTVGELYITQTSKTGWTLKTKQKPTQHKKNAEHAFFTSSKFPWMIDHVGFTKCVLAILNSTLAHAARYFFFSKWTEYNYSVCLGHVQIYYKTTTWQVQRTLPHLHTHTILGPDIVSAGYSTLVSIWNKPSLQ